jgi:antitoxin (DNA-binding transcriptional repressor) of toxin-antitoxin stability system
MQINIHEPSVNLPQLVERVIAGEEIIFDKAEPAPSHRGEPIAKLIPYSQQPTKKAKIVFGVWEGKVKIADDFDQLPPDIAEALGMEG